MIPFTDLEYLEIGEASVAHDQVSADDAYHQAEERREIEELTEHGRMPAW